MSLLRAFVCCLLHTAQRKEDKRTNQSHFFAMSYMSHERMMQRRHRDAANVGAPPASTQLDGPPAPTTPQSNSAQRKDKEQAAVTVASPKGCTLACCSRIGKLEKENAQLRARVAELEALLGLSPPKPSSSAAAIAHAPAADLPHCYVICEGLLRCPFSEYDRVAFRRSLREKCGCGVANASEAYWDQSPQRPLYHAHFIFTAKCDLKAARERAESSGSVAVLPKLFVVGDARSSNAPNSSLHTTPLVAPSPTRRGGDAASGGDRPLEDDDVLVVVSEHERALQADAVVAACGNWLLRKALKDGRDVSKAQQ